jgi:hypothetical protein
MVEKCKKIHLTTILWYRQQKRRKRFCITDKITYFCPSLTKERQFPSSLGRLDGRERCREGNI